MQLLRKRTALCAAFVAFSLQASSQIGIGTTTPDPNSILHLQATDKGVLIPHLTSQQMTTLANTLGGSAKGMLVTDASTGNLMGWNGKIWTDPANLTATDPLSVSKTNQVALNPGTQTGDLISWDGNNWVNIQPTPIHFNFTMDNHQPYLTLNYCIALEGVFPPRNDAASPFVSQVCLFPFNFPPTGWAFCNGQLLPISQYTAVFSLVGTYYGGDGKSTFALPNLQSRIPIGAGQGQGLSNYDIGEMGGEESNTISH